MKRADLKAGDRVWIVLPYEGGRGWATVIATGDLDGVRVEFDHEYSHIFQWQNRIVSPRQIVKKENA